MSNEAQVYEVWGFAGRGSPKLVSSDPVEIVHWLRANGIHGYNVHPRGFRFHDRKMISHDFISRHSKATAEDIVRRAVEKNNFDGLVTDLHALFFGINLKETRE